MNSLRPTRPRNLGAVICVALLATLGIGAPALAHNVVEDLIPTPGSTLTTSPVSVSVATDDAFLDLGENLGAFAILMVDQDGFFYGDGCVELIERQMSASIDLGLGGTYQVIYQFVSADGHILSDSYTLVFEPDDSHAPVSGLPEAPVCGVDSTFADPPMDSSSETSKTESDVEAPTLIAPSGSQTPNIPAWVWVTGPLLVVLIAGVGWYRARQKRD